MALFLIILIILGSFLFIIGMIYLIRKLIPQDIQETQTKNNQETEIKGLYSLGKQSSPKSQKGNRPPRVKIMDKKSIKNYEFVKNIKSDKKIKAKVYRKKDKLYYKKTPKDFQCDHAAIASTFYRYFLDTDRAAKVSIVIDNSEEKRSKYIFSKKNKSGFEQDNIKEMKTRIYSSQCAVWRIKDCLAPIAIAQLICAEYDTLHTQNLGINDKNDISVIDYDYTFFHIRGIKNKSAYNHLYLSKYTEGSSRFRWSKRKSSKDNSNTDEYSKNWLCKFKEMIADTLQEIIKRTNTRKSKKDILKIIMRLWLLDDLLIRTFVSQHTTDETLTNKYVEYFKLLKKVFFEAFELAFDKVKNPFIKSFDYQIGEKFVFVNEKEIDEMLKDTEDNTRRILKYHQGLKFNKNLIKKSLINNFKESNLFSLDENISLAEEKTKESHGQKISLFKSYGW